MDSNTITLLLLLHFPDAVCMYLYVCVGGCVEVWVYERELESEDR